MSKRKDTNGVPPALIREHHGIAVKIAKGEFIFRQGEKGRTFFVVKKGRVKMVSVNEDGKEFVQGYFDEGSSFGEPPFFTGEAYPASAVAVVDSEIWKIGREDFLLLLKKNFDVHLSITESLSKRLEYKSMMLSELAVEEAEHRIRTLLQYFREQEGIAHRGFEVPFSRQQIADMSGLRVETVIRAIKGMEHKGLLEIDEEGKITIR